VADGYNKIFVTSKWRFLQSEASLWFISNRFYYIAFIVGFTAYFWFLFFPTDHFIRYSKYIGILVALWSFYVVVKRQMFYYGYYAGYEQGFVDAATRSLDYWGSREDSDMYESRIQQALNEIEANEMNISDTHKADRSGQIKEGYMNFWGAKVLDREMNPIIQHASPDMKK
jgi:hypothetical protein